MSKSLPFGHRWGCATSSLLFLPCCSTGQGRHGPISQEGCSGTMRQQSCQEQAVTHSPEESSCHPGWAPGMLLSEAGSALARCVQQSQGCLRRNCGIKGGWELRLSEGRAAVFQCPCSPSSSPVQGSAGHSPCLTPEG